MTEGPLKHEKPMCVRIWLEVGHACEPRRSLSGRALALDWRVWVRGIGGQDISGFVHKVVFLLHPPEAFVYPKRVLQEPPYEIQESGCVSLMIPIEVYLKYSSKPKKIVLRYNLHIENDLKSSSESTCVYYDFKNPSEQLLEELMRGGAEAMRSPGSRGDKLVVILPDDKDKYKDSDGSRKRKYYFVEPIKCEHGPKKGTKSYILEDICSKCGESFKINFKKLFASASMSEGEVGRITRLYSSFSSYENSVDALPLPPLTDSIYELPSLPYSLRGALTAPAVDHVLQ